MHFDKMSTFLQNASLNFLRCTDDVGNSGLGGGRLRLEGVGVGADGSGWKKSGSDVPGNIMPGMLVKVHAL